MLTLYLAALIVGGGALLVQLAFSSHTGDGGGHHELHAGDVAVAEADADHADASEHAGGWASIFLSLRFYTFAAMAFGLVGAPATWLELSPALPTLLVALGTGLGLGLLASLGFRVLGRQTLSSGALASDLIGQVGRVLVACEKGRPGKVRLSVRGQIVDYIASTGEARLEPGTSVIVEEVREGRLEVSAAPREFLTEQDGGGSGNG